MFPHFWSFFLNCRLCGPDPIENVVYGFVQLRSAMQKAVFPKGLKLSHLED